MGYYDKIAKPWNASTGTEGGAFKEYVLNAIILNKIRRIEGLSILEVGAGNGYFVPLMLKHFSGQSPAEIVITDQSRKLLGIVRQKLKSDMVHYEIVDVRKPFPFKDAQFNLIIATMVFNEIPDHNLQYGLKECYRVLTENGRLLATVLHPKFVFNLDRRGEIRQSQNGSYTMPGSKGHRLPVIKRSLSRYYSLFKRSKFVYTVEDVYPTTKVLNAKPGLKKAGKNPLAAVFMCTKIFNNSEVAA